jgi:hypothetical protein
MKEKDIDNKNNRKGETKATNRPAEKQRGQNGKKRI